jgi:type I restriction enzyme M protein
VQLIDASKCSVKRRKPIGNKRNEFTDECIQLITNAYNAFADGVWSDGELVVECKVKDNDEFKYTKVVVEQPLLDEAGNPVLKKGKMQPDSSRRDSESIPYLMDIEEYMQKNVYPYAPEAWIDEKKSKIGYEIPFTREFYKYVAPRSSESIFANLQSLEQQEQELMSKIMGR